MAGSFTEVPHVSCDRNWDHTYSRYSPRRTWSSPTRLFHGIILSHLRTKRKINLLPEDLMGIDDGEWLPSRLLSGLWPRLDPRSSGRRCSDTFVWHASNPALVYINVSASTLERILCNISRAGKTRLILCRDAVLPWAILWPKQSLSWQSCWRDCDPKAIQVSELTFEVDRRGRGELSVFWRFVCFLFFWGGIVSAGTVTSFLICSHALC